MGKQKAHKRKIEQERRAKEQLRNGGSGQAVILPSTIVGGNVAPTKDPVQSSTPAPTAVVSSPAPIVREQPVPAAANLQPQIPRGERKPGDTVAGQSKYDRYFAIVAQAVRENMIGGFRSLGFIPGPAVILAEDNAKVAVLAATPEEARRLGKIPTAQMEWSQLPEEISKALVAYEQAICELGFDPSPYHLGLAKKLLAGKVPPQHLTMLMSNFRYKAGDPERPFGVVLLPTNGGVKISKIYNPANVSDVPAEGTTLTLDQLKNGFGPIQKLLRTWALMEDNYSWRYNEDGSPKDHLPIHPSQFQRKSGEEGPAPSQFRQATLAK